MISPKIHRELTRIVAALGPTNPAVRFMLKRACSKHGVDLRFAEAHVDVVRGRNVIRVEAKQFVYVVDLASHFDIYFGELVPTTIDGELLLDCSRPRLHRYVKTQLEFELASLPEETKALEGYFRWYRPMPGDTVFDIGAYCGVSTYVFSKCVGYAGKVFSFEPDPTNFELLQRNIDRHGLTNVFPIKLAISDKSGLEKFCTEGNLGSGLRSDMSRATTGEVQEVRTISLEDAIGTYGVPSFAKIDIEGAEVRVLSAARPCLKRHSIQFVLDTNHWVDGVRTAAAVEKVFAEAGYVVKSSDEFGFMTTWARKGAVEG